MNRFTSRFIPFSPHPPPWILRGIRYMSTALPPIQTMPPYSMVISDLYIVLDELHKVSAEALWSLACSLSYNTKANGECETVCSFPDLLSLMKAQQVASAYCKAVIRPQSVPKTYVFQNNPDLPTASPKTRIVLINNSAQVEPICATLLKEGKLDSLQGQCVLGLDCEWKPDTAGENNPISVIQLSSGYHTAVFHLPTMGFKGTAIPLPIRRIFEAPEVIKVVLSPNDTHKLKTAHNITPQSVVDVQELPLVKYRFSNCGLSHMANMVLKIAVSKHKGKHTNWSRPLTANEIVYAGLDAELTRELYFKITRLPLI